MKSEWIEAILAVEQTRSFSRSAEVLYCSQSAVTRMVQSAEEELGMQIFSRQSKKAKVELTADGTGTSPYLHGLTSITKKNMYKYMLAFLVLFLIVILIFGAVMNVIM